MLLIAKIKNIVYNKIMDIKQKVKQLPTNSGVYIMENQVIYNNFEFKINHTLFVANLK